MRAQTVVVGAGVVGLAIARALARRGDDVVVLEAEDAYGQHASSRNSEVIHAGLHYPAGSLKARLCNAGRPQLIAFCRDHGIEHRLLGKLIVATEPAEVAALERIAANARECDGGPLHWLDAAAVQRREPALRTCGALWSPATGVLDSHGLMRTLLRDAQAHGAMLALKTPALSLRRLQDGFVLQTPQGPLAAEQVIVSAGAGAQALATTLEDLAPEFIPARYLAKGTYAKLCGPSPCNTLVYPVPDSASLGVHLTLDLGGAARFGPDQEWVEHADVAVDPSRLRAFVPAIRHYWPGLPDNALQPDYAGIRVKTQAPGTPMADFTILGPAAHGLRGLVLLYGIESPGLTSGLALADEVALHLETP